MRIIGLTGGVGSGKSLAAEILQKITGARLLVADELGHVAMVKDTIGYQKILDAFGEKVLSPNGEIDRKKLADMVFADRERLQQLNDIVHPLVKDYLSHYIRERRKQEGTMILENAIMFETGCDKFCDQVWYVWVPEEVRVQRLQESRGYSREKCEAIMAQQMQEASFRNRCQKTIKNTGSVEELEETLKTCWRNLQMEFL